MFIKYVYIHMYVDTCIYYYIYNTGYIVRILVSKMTTLQFTKSLTYLEVNWRKNRLGGGETP